MCFLCCAAGVHRRLVVLDLPVCVVHRLFAAKLRKHRACGCRPCRGHSCLTARCTNGGRGQTSTRTNANTDTDTNTITKRHGCVFATTCTRTRTRTSTHAAFCCAVVFRQGQKHKRKKARKQYEHTECDAAGCVRSRYRDRCTNTNTNTAANTAANTIASTNRRFEFGCARPASAASSDDRGLGDGRN